MTPSDAVRRLPTIHAQFFRAVVAIGSLAALFAALGIGLADTFSARRIIIDNLIYYSEAMSRVASYNIDNHRELGEHLQHFSGQPGLEISCVYNESGALIAAWHEKSNQKKCPSLIINRGIQENFFSIVIAKPIISEENSYKGIVYLEGALSEMKFFLTRIAVVIVILLVCIIGVAAIAARRTARRISQPLRDLVRQIDQLHEDDVTMSDTSMKQMTEECSVLLNAVLHLRNSLKSTMVPRAQVDSMRRWQESRLAGLLSLLRSRLPQNSPLLPCIADYTRLLELDSKHMPQQEVFDLSRIADSALVTAKKIQPPGPQLHVTLSLKADMPKHWLGYGELVEALLRQMLLISLKRTASGLVCLRLEAGNLAGDSILYFTLEDSGGTISHAQIEVLLAEANEGASSLLKPLDISWLLIARTVQALSGQIRPAIAHSGGLALQGWIQLGVAETQEVKRPIGGHSPAESANPPLILMIDDDPVNLQVQRLLFEKAGCSVFAVKDGASALEWAPLLPFSMIIIDKMLPDMPGMMVAARIRHMISAGQMPKTPLVALSATSMPQDRTAWIEGGVQSVLVKPLATEDVKQLCRMMHPLDQVFFSGDGGRMAADIPASLTHRMPELTRHLYDYLQDFCAMLGASAALPDLANSAHMVKSAALTLGYDRLAACLGAIEHRASMQDKAFFDDNASVIREYLEYAVVAASRADQNPAQRVALSS